MKMYIHSLTADGADCQLTSINRCILLTYLFYCISYRSLLMLAYLIHLTLTNGTLYCKALPIVLYSYFSL